MADCIEDIMGTIGPNSSIQKADVEALVAHAQIIKAAYAADGEVAVSQAMKVWLESKRVDVKEQAQLRKREAAINSITRAEMYASVTENFKGKDVGKGVRSLLVGDGFANDLSADSIGVKYKTKWNDGINYGIESIDGKAMDIYESGKNDIEIAQAMSLLDKQESGHLDANGRKELADIDQLSKDVAGVLRKESELQRLQMNKAGGNVEKRSGHVFKASHNADKMYNAGYVKWEAFIRDKLDYQAVFDMPRSALMKSKEGVELYENVMESMFHSNSTGTHVQSITGKADAGGGKKAGSIAAKISKERLLVFKDGRSFMEYQKEFGAGQLKDGVGSQVQSNARAIGLLKSVGTRPEQNVDAVVEMLIRRYQSKESLDPEALKELGSKTFDWRLKNDLAYVSGQTGHSANGIIGNIFQWARWAQSLSKLSQAALSALSDPVNMGAQAKSMGRSALSGYSDALNGLFAHKVPRDVQKQIAKSMHIATDVSRSSMGDMWMNPGNAAGFRAKTMNQFFKMIGLEQFTNAMKRGHITGEATWLGEMSAKPFKDIEIGTQRALDGVGIGEAEFDILRQAVKEIHGDELDFKVIAPEEVLALADDVFTPYLKSKNEPVNSVNIDRLRERLSDSLSAYYHVQSTSAVVEPTGRIQSAMTMGTSDGTALGVALRTALQFKSHPISMFEQRLVRDVQLRTGKRAGLNKDTLGMSGLKAWGPAMGFYLAQSSLFGYGAMTMKDLAKGNKPRDPRDPRTFMAAMLQGGGIGIYGDFIFGDMKNRFGGGVFSTLLGPTYGTLNQMGDIVGRTKENVFSGGKHNVMSSIINLVQQNTPFANIPYIKLTVDFLFMEALKENFNPGQYTRKQVSKMKRTGQQSWIPMKPLGIR